jgi:hypothetical protein
MVAVVLTCSETTAELLAMILGPEGSKVDLGVLRGPTKKLMNVQVCAEDS